MQRWFRSFCTILICGFSVLVYGQSENSGHPDLEKLEGLIEAAQYEEASRLATNLIESARQADDVPLLLQAQACEASIYADLGEPAKAKALIEQIMQEALIQLPDTGEIVTDLYETLGTIAFKRADYDAALEAIRTQLDLVKKRGDIDSPAIANAFQNIAVIHGELGSLDSSIYYNRLALPIQEAYKDSNPAMYAFLLSNIGVDYGLMGDYYQAVKYVEQAHALRKEIYGDAHPDLAMSYHNLAYLASRNGDYQRALEYYEAAIRIYISTLGADHPNVILTQNMWGDVMLQLEKYTTAEELFTRLLDLQVNDPEASEQALYLAYSRLGMTQYFLQKYAKGEAAIRAAIRIVEQAHGMDHPYRGEYLDKLSLILAAQGRHQEAWEVGKETLRIYTLHYQAPHQDLVYTHFNQANYAVELGWKDTADRYFQLAAKAAAPPAEKRYLGRQISRELVRLYAAQSAAYTRWANEAPSADSSKVWLKSAHQAASEGRLVLDTLRKQGFMRNSLLALGQWGHTYLLQQGLDISIRLYRQTGTKKWLQEALYFADQSKYGVMRDALRKARIEHSGGVPPAMLDSLNQLELRLGQDQRTLQLMAETDSGYSEVQARFVSRLGRQRQLESELLETYPEFAALRYQGPTWALEDIQSQISAGSSILYMAQGSDSLYLITLNRDQIQVTGVSGGADIAEMGPVLRRSIYGYFISEQQDKDRYAAYADTFSQTASALYQRLINPVKSQLHNRVIIIPAGSIGYIPFSALLESKPNDPVAFDQHTYWGKKTALSYAFALGWWHQQQKVPQMAARDAVLAMAPSFTGTASPSPTLATRGSYLGPLRFNQREVNQVADHWPTTILEGEAATLETFLDQAPHYRIIHLATHAKAFAPGQGEAFCAFAGADTSNTAGRLYLPDLYHMRLPADLVVLSACETGIGPLQSGEGIASLAGGFAQAGAARVLTTLWSVQDQQTAALMPGFYAQLKAGLAPDEALAEVQRAHIAQSDAYLAHPFFWAGFALYGRATPLELPSPWGWWVWALLGAGLICVAILLLKSLK